MYLRVHKSIPLRTTRSAISKRPNNGERKVVEPHFTTLFSSFVDVVESLENMAPKKATYPKKKGTRPRKNKLAGPSVTRKKP